MDSIYSLISNRNPCHFWRIGYRNRARIIPLFDHFSSSSLPQMGGRFNPGFSL